MHAALRVRFNIDRRIKRQFASLSINFMCPLILVLIEICADLSLLRQNAKRRP